MKDSKEFSIEFQWREFYIAFRMRNLLGHLYISAQIRGDRRFHSFSRHYRIGKNAYPKA